MNNLINETNTRLQEIIENLKTIKEEYEKKILVSTEQIDKELELVESYKKDFFESKEKIEKMNSDIEGFEQDYQSLVDRFKNDELANILIAANKEISLKIEERKRKILKDKESMNELVEKAETVKKRLIKLTAERKALEQCLESINDSYTYYNESLTSIIDYSTNNVGHLTKNKEENIKHDDVDLDSISINVNENVNTEEIKEEVKEEYNNMLDDDINIDSLDLVSVDEEETTTDEEIEDEINEEDEEKLNFLLDDSIEDDNTLYENEKEDE